MLEEGRSSVCSGRQLMKKFKETEDQGVASAVNIRLVTSPLASTQVCINKEEEIVLEIQNRDDSSQSLPIALASSLQGEPPDSY